MTTTMTIDTTRGFDVFYRAKLLRHFDNYEEARAFEAAGRGRYIRYWAVKGS